MDESPDSRPYISVVIPSFNEDPNIPVMVERLKAVLSGLGSWEIIFCDDGSRDNTLEIVRTLRAADRRIRYVSFSRNFGHQNALRAGLERARGELVVSMDGDLQHPPELVPDLVARQREGYDVVYTIRGKEKGQSWFKRLSSGFFYGLVNVLSDVRIEDGTADFRLLTRKALDALLAFREHGVFWRGAVPWVGFRQYGLVFEPSPRLYGQTKYTLRRMFRFAMDGITSFSVKPLHLTTMAGVACSALAFVYALYALGMRLFSDRTVEGWTSLLISVLFIGGIQLISLGILGEYLGKLFIEVKGRPHYIVTEESD
jgi:dolichol-phosphate mannosyltransferase